MCGIFGEFGRDLQRSDTTARNTTVRRVSRTLEHRGPDDEGAAFGDGWWLGFRRLAILDLSPAGHQPMATPDGRYWLVFNGEIYNYRELGAALEQSGVTLRSRSDTEVLLHILAREGAEGLKRLNGMFALAFIDTERRTFLLARDRLGVKPLYWQRQGGGLRFASELKGLLAWPQAPRAIDRAAVAEFLCLGYLSPDRCIVEGCAKLPPGHVAEGSLDAPEIAPRPYWSLEIDSRVGGRGNQTLADADLDELEALVADAVRIRLRSDVPVGVFLSGGIDSGLVAALAAGQSSGSLLALSVTFPGASGDESDLARATAARLGLDLRLLEQRPTALGDLDRLAPVYDEPFGDSSALPTLQLCAAAAGHATVFLSGDGGDEAFGGYRHYVQMGRYGWLRHVPDPLLSLGGELARRLPPGRRAAYRLAKIGLPDMGMAAVFDGFGLAQDPALQAILPPDLRGGARGVASGVAASVQRAWERSRGRPLLDRQRALDYALYLPEDILVKMDRASMAHSIEVRSPFLDYRVVEWAAKLPATALIDGEQGKIPLRALARRHLPPPVSAGLKRGFGAPVGDWLREPAGARFAAERLLDGGGEGRGLWDRAGAARLLELHGAGRGRDFGDLLWRLLVLESWARHHLGPAEGKRGGRPATPALSLAAAHKTTKGGKEAAWNRFASP
ncbi:asparagine synthase (glutamine-hydrolyzing) [Azospirillum sp. sgz302134]